MKANKPARSGFLLAALGMICGDIATSPMYVLKYVAAEGGGQTVTGAVSLILWALLLLTTVKGVLLLLREDNCGEGGHFALYALVREQGKWMIVPACLGGAALLADSVLTPALTLTAAVEGSSSLIASGNLPQQAVIISALVLITALFLLQGLGSRRTGRFLGPVMLLWLLFLAVFGAVQIPSAPGILRALDPRTGVRFLFGSGNAKGFSFLGLVFLAVTGTEILYANLDYAGRRAITWAWPFVLVCLSLSYLGQGAWLLANGGGAAVAADPFFRMLPPVFRVFALVLALAAAWAASQTVINGSFTLVSEAIRLDLLPALKILYPSDSIRHEYIPSVNFLMWLFSCAAVIVFRSGRRMASVYGLMIALSMLTTTLMLFPRFRVNRSGSRGMRAVLILLGALEAVFFSSSLGKLRTGGTATLLFALLLAGAMLVWNRGGTIERRFSARLPLREHLAQLSELSADASYRKLADHLVYIDAGDDMETVDQAILYSILDRGPKRAGMYWFVSVNTVSEPYAQWFRAESFGSDHVFRLKLELGYKCSRPLTWYLRSVFLEMEKQGFARVSRKSYSLSAGAELGTFHYCVLRRRFSGAETLSLSELWTLRLRTLLQELAGAREEWYAEEDTNVEVEWIPLSLVEESPIERLQRLLSGEDENERE